MLGMTGFEHVRGRMLSINHGITVEKNLTAADGGFAWIGQR